MMFRTDAGVVGTMLVSQVSPGRKNHLHLEVAGADASLRFEQEHSETLWIGRREHNETLWRDPAALHPSARRCRAAARARRGLRRAASRRSSRHLCGDRRRAARRAAALRRRRAVDALVDAVLASARAGAAWVEV